MADFKFLPQDLSNPDPKGKNGLSAFADYYQRLLYREVYPSHIWSPLDTWYDKQYYGKVDRIQNTVVPAPGMLAAIRTAKTPNLLALNFVARAFDKLATHMQQAKLVGVLDPDGTSMLWDMKATRAYEDPMKIYGEYLNTVFESFNSKMAPFTDQITNFSSFYREFVTHLLMVGEYCPLTLTNYLLTDTISPFSSGLTVALDTAQFDDDSYKYTTFVEDPNYDFYVRSAKKWGLIVNKNAPWLLTADLFSDAAMKQIHTVMPVTKEAFFFFYYNLTCWEDIPILKKFIINSYKSFIERNPWSEKRIVKPGCDIFKVDRSMRPQLGSNANTSNLITDKQLVNLYLVLRSREAGNPLQITKKLYTELNSLYVTPSPMGLLPLDNVVNYINLIYRDYIYSASYPALNMDVFKDLDNQVRRGKMSTAGSIVKQLY